MRTVAISGRRSDALGDRCAVAVPEHVIEHDHRRGQHGAETQCLLTPALRPATVMPGATHRTAAKARCPVDVADDEHAHGHRGPS